MLTGGQNWNLNEKKWAISKGIADLVEVGGIGGAVYSASTDQELVYTIGALAITFVAKLAGNYFNNKNINEHITEHRHDYVRFR
jgi:hypothetical protein